MNARDVLEVLGLVLAVVAPIGAVAWWLIWPRIEDKLTEVAHHAQANAKQLQPGGELHDNARLAATAARELPALRSELAAMAEHGSKLAQETAARVTVLEGWRPQVDRRLGVTEQSLLALLGPELIARLRVDLDLDETLRKETPDEP